MPLNLTMQRIKYLARKVRYAWAHGDLLSRVLDYLSRKFVSRVWATFNYLRLPKSDRRLAIKQGFADHRSDADHHRADDTDLRRIIAAYKAAKSAQAHVAEEFQVRGQWFEWIDVNHGLIRALIDEDLSSLRAIYDNFHREPVTSSRTGGVSYLSNVMFKTSIFGRFYGIATWCDYRDRFLRQGLPLDQVRYPKIGNPVGIPLNGDIVPVQTFRNAHHGAEMAEWLRDCPEATVVEIGSGLGGQCFQTLHYASGNIARYICFDIPEVAATCAYFLLSAFPDRRIRLYGEGDVATGADEAYDIAVFPHFTAPMLSDDSVDLFHNASSFSEMDGRSARAYMAIMERASRRYIHHINHDKRMIFRYPDGTVSENMTGSLMVPDATRFKRVFRKPRVLELANKRLYRSYNEYLFERVDDARPGPVFSPPAADGELFESFPAAHLPEE